MLADLLSGGYEHGLEESWKNERTATPVRTFAVRLHNSWVGSQASVREWLEQFMYYYRRQRPYQALDGKAPIEAVQN
ncbi:hypothetical protein G9C83_15310 [Halobacterium sp. R2-5]|nr:hypothetical protein [Halobacterium sp. R2-5]